MKNFFRIIGFLFLFCLFGCLGIVDESLISSVSFKIKIPESIQSEKSSVARNATTENLKLVVNLETKESDEVRTEEKSVSVGQEVLISFDEIPVGNEIRIVGKLYNSEEAVIYEGESAWIIIQAGKNEVELLMKKVIVEEEVIVNAEQPEIITDVNSFVFVKGSEETSTTLECSAKSIDGGVISFQWQVKNAKGEWENVEESDVANEESNSLYTSVLSISVSNFELNETKYYKCIVTNTNNEVNGTKTASVEKTATVAYVEGTLSSITAVYTGSYELFGTDINLANITVTESWTSGEKVFDIPVLASSNRYNIAKKSNDIGDYVIGNVPYTLSYEETSANSDATITYDLVIPVKYKLSTDAIKLISKFDGNTVAESDNGTETTLNVPQYGTVECEISPTDIGNGLSIINDDGNEGESIIPSDFGEYYSATIKKGETVVEKGAVWDDDEETTYDVIVAVTSKNDWFVCDENLPKKFTVNVFLWNISVGYSISSSEPTEDIVNAQVDDEGNFVVPENASKYTVSVTNEVIQDGLSNEFEYLAGENVVDDREFSVDEGSNVITVKYNGNTIGSITVEIAAIGSEAFPVTDWDDLIDIINPSTTTTELITVYIKGNIVATSTGYVCRPVILIPVIETTITRTKQSDSDELQYLFSVEANFTVGNETSDTITISDSVTDSSYPLINCTRNSEVNFYNCIFGAVENASNEGSVLYASAAEITLNDCTIKNCKGSAIVINGEWNNGIKFSLNTCAFYENETDITVKVCTNLTLSGEMNISSLYFENESMTDGNYPTYNVELGNNLSGSVKISACSYDSLEIFKNEIILPPNVFTLASTEYEITTEGKVQKINNNDSGTTSGNSIIDIYQLETALLNAESGSYSQETPCVIEITGNSDGYMDMLNSITINSHIKLVPVGNSDVTLGRGAGLTAGNIFVVSQNASLTVGDADSSASLIIDGASENNITSTKSLINVASGGTLVLNENSVLQNNLCNGTQGGAVYSEGGTIIINGGVISSNKIDDTSNGRYGGGIYLKEGNFTMTSGKFSSNSVSSDNSSKYAYGGALALENCTVNISGGDFIGNFVKTNSTEGYGGAIYIIGQSSSTENNPYNISNCSFTLNSAYQRGAAIYIGTAGYLNINNCDFLQNTISNEEQGLQNGGTVYNGDKDSITIMIDGNNPFTEYTFNCWNPT